MWYKFSRIILRYRFLLAIILCLTTLVLGYEAREAQIDYNLAKIIPEDHQSYLDYVKFKDEFGQDGNLLIIAVEKENPFDRDFFVRWFTLGNDIKKIKGVEEIISIAHAYTLIKDENEKKFNLTPIVKELPYLKYQLDSIRSTFESLPFYEGRLYNNGVTIMAARFDDARLNSEDRMAMVADIQKLTDAFQYATKLKLHLSGLPFIRSVRMEATMDELRKVLVYAVILLIVVLLILFKSFYAVFIPMLVVGIGVIWAQGMLVLLGYKITILTALIPNLMVIIGVPNCVYLLNRYHNEFKRHGNKVRALSRIIEKIGYVTFFANLTTAIGFGVFYFTRSAVLQEFGIAAGLMICFMFLISIVSIPVLFSFLPKPKFKQTRYLDSRILNRQLDFIDHYTHHKRKMIYFVTGAMLVLAIGGIVQLKAKGFILDDVPKDSRVYQDLKFLETHFKGIMPLEILIDTRRRGGALKSKTLKKIDQVQDSLYQHEFFSQPVSVTNGLKFATQAYFNGNPKHYRLPKDNFTMPEMGLILPYLNNTSAGGQLSTNFVDSLKQVARISLQIPDIGSHRLQELLDVLHSIFDPIFDAESYDVKFTGTSIIALEGYNFLISGLINSVLLAFLLIACIMAYLFKSLKMLILSLTPNLIPLILTAGIMGYWNIPLKPSTVLVFSVAFGISVDFTIHFLAKYKQELNRHRWDIPKTVSITIHETGVSMIYTSVILFFGFITFATSSFDGTKYLGILVSITLVTSLFSNMFLLPSLLLSYDKRQNKHK